MSCNPHSKRVVQSVGSAPFGPARWMCARFLSICVCCSPYPAFLLAPRGPEDGLYIHREAYIHNRLLSQDNTCFFKILDCRCPEPKDREKPMVALFLRFWSVNHFFFICVCVRTRTCAHVRVRVCVLFSSILKDYRPSKNNIKKIVML